MSWLWCYGLASTSRRRSPGLRFKLPFGIDQVIGVPVERVFKEEFGFRTLRAGVRTQYDPRDYSDESLLLTGDLNIADVEWVVQYQISEPQKFLFAIRDATRSLRDLSMKPSCELSSVTALLQKC